MRPFALGTFSIAGGTPFGALVLNERALALRALGRVVPRVGTYFARMTSTLDLVEDWERGFPILIEAAAALASSEHGDAFQSLSVSVDRLHVHPPVAARQIFAVGANYRQHVVDMMVKSAGEGANLEDTRRAAEALMNERARTGLPYVFTKLPTALAGADDPLVIPEMVRQCDWEIELAVVIGRHARHVAAADAMSYVAGYAVFNDVSARGLQHRPDLKDAGADWLSCKSQPGFAPFGPYIVPAEFVPSPYDLRMTLALDGKLMQDGNTGDMLFKIDRVLEFLSSRVQLLPGDIISTGSPTGNGAIYGRFLRPGDLMEATIAGLGTQRVRCVAETATEA
jgi:2,4-didehydro-3-deoxy-L-rhamnonate hydrolase